MISTDSKHIEELLSRGVENIYPKREFLEARLKDGKQLTLYTGYDPTGPTLHLGHGITLLKLRQFQQLGHKIIFLIGDFTAMIGDPTDKMAARTVLSREQVLENCALYQQQASRVLDFGGDNPAIIRYNSQWLSSLTFADILELTSCVTVQNMITRDMFQRRLQDEKPIFLNEFMYPLMQGYDSVAMNVDGEVGGNDQTFNMLMGRDFMNHTHIMSRYGKNDHKTKEKFVLTIKLLADSTGKKMSKTEKNMIAFTDTPEDMFGKVMRFDDALIVNAFELCTMVTEHEVSGIADGLHTGNVNPRDAKLRLAYEITKTFLGEAAAERGREHFKNVIQEKDKPEEIAELKPTANDIVTVLVEAGFVKSKTEARQQIDGKGVRINDTVVEAYDATVAAGDVVQKGKRFFVKVV